MDTILELKNVTKIFSGHGIIPTKRTTHIAVNDVNLSIKKNTVFGLVGESGCGKTTLARSILLLDPPSHGHIQYKGKNLERLSRKQLMPYRKKMQIVFQDPHSALNPKMSIFQSMKEGLVNRNHPKNKIKEKITELLDLVGITPSHMNRFPHEFSGGQKQRIVIARALSMEPELLVLDEPVSSLDVSIQAQIINLLMDLKQKLNLTYFFISHDLNLVSYLSDRIGVMYQGRLIEMADTEQILKEPIHPYTLKLYSSSPGKMNIGTKNKQNEKAASLSAELPDGFSFFQTPGHETGSFEMISIKDSHLVGCYRN